MKLNPLRDNIAGKRLVVVDDSIVRGTTTRAMVKMLREAGAREVHLRISSPPYKWPCFYGMDTGTRGELLAANLTVDEIRDYVDADTISYLTLDRLLEATGDNPRDILTRIGELPQVLGSHLYGDVVRVLWDSAGGPGAAPDALRAALAAHQTTAHVRPVPVDMETAFAHLAEAAPRRALPVPPDDAEAPR